MECDRDDSLPQFLAPHAHSIDRLKQVGQRFSQRGWCQGYSGSFSLVVQRDPTQLLITGANTDKGCLTAQNFTVVDSAGHAIQTEAPELPSDTVLHCLIGQQDQVQAVLHTCSLWSTILSTRLAALGGVLIEGYEMLTGLSGVSTGQHAEWLPIIPNDENAAALTERVRACLSSAEQPMHGFILQQSGIYTWGRNLDEAIRHVEVLEFLVEAIARQAAK